MNTKKNPIERLFRRRAIDEATGCWNWLGKISRKGYGVITITSNKKHTTPEVHRYAFSLFNNVTLLPHNIVHHKCHNRRCFNPDHLEVTTTVYNNLEKKYNWATFCSLHSELINEYNNIHEKLQKAYSDWAKCLK